MGTYQIQAYAIIGFKCDRFVATRYYNKVRHVLRRWLILILIYSLDCIYFIRMYGLFFCLCLKILTYFYCTDFTHQYVKKWKAAAFKNIIYSPHYKEKQPKKWFLKLVKIECFRWLYVFLIRNRSRIFNVLDVVLS